MAGQKPKRKKPNPEVEAFAAALQEWAAQPPDQEQKERLLRWLLSRCESHGFIGSEGKYVIERREITYKDIDQAVMDALAGYNPDLPTSGWVRGGPIWPRGYGYGDFWPRG